MPHSKPLPLSTVYSPNLSLLTDLYQLTMAYGYWKNGIHNRESCFHLFFRKLPFEGGYAIAAGLEWAIDYLKNFSFSESDLFYLSSLSGNDGNPLFSKEFLTFLSTSTCELTVHAIPEGTLVYPNEPLMRIEGPLWQAQLVETFLLTIINFQTLVATKAARLRDIAPEDTFLEFGLRRAQGIDGGLSASRAAFIGGCDATSNVLAGKLFNIPVRGTHAHSWVMAFESEQKAFDLYAQSLPNNAVFLVDTYNTLNGVKKAIKTGHELRKKGFDLVGIRLDSGDLAYLSIEARKLLDSEGFTSTRIVASNDLDEYTINSLKMQGAQITVWGVGTKLVTSYDQPALGGVYKLAAIKDQNGHWDMKVKLSEQAIKVSNPGILQVRRFKKDNRFRGDMIYDVLNPGQLLTITDPADFTRQKTFDTSHSFEDLLLPIMQNGKISYDFPDLLDIQKRTREQVVCLHPTTRRLDVPHEYPVGLEETLFHTKAELIKKLRKSE